MNEILYSTIRLPSSLRSKETPAQRRKKRRIQIMIGLLVLTACVAIGLLAQGENGHGAYIWMIGLSFGYVLQRSRFCFTASIRDPLLTGTTSLTKAVLIALALSSVGYMALQMKATGMGLEHLGGDMLKSVIQLPGHVRPVGVHTVLGGFLFGVGAVIAGGCASGTLMRMGEGFVQQWMTLIFFIIGSVIGVLILPLMIQTRFLYQKTAIYLPQLLGGWGPAIVVQFGLLFVLYVLADWYGRKKSGEI